MDGVIYKSILGFPECRIGSDRSVWRRKNVECRNIARRNGGKLFYDANVWVQIREKNGVVQLPTSKRIVAHKTVSVNTLMTTYFGKEYENHWCETQANQSSGPS